MGLDYNISIRNALFKPFCLFRAMKREGIRLHYRFLFLDCTANAYGHFNNRLASTSVFSYISGNAVPFA
jgi:hypothetical protein